MKLHRHILRHGLLGGMLLLAGCGLPPAVVIASYALGGASYVTTGKGVTDHAISAVSGQDCALHRMVTEAGNVCDDVLSDDIFLAENAITEGWAPGGDLSIGASALVATPVVVAKPVAPAFGGVPSRNEPGERYLVLGSFADADNADRMALKLADMEAAAVATDVDGRAMHRVVVPMDWKTEVAAAGFDDAWPVELCPGTLEAAPCAAAPAITLLAAVPR